MNQSPVKSRAYFVSRHAGALEWARRQGVDAEILAHLDPQALAPGDTVLGTLPAHLVADLGARGISYRHLSMELPESMRGQEIDADTMERLGARLEDIVAFRPAAMESPAPPARPPATGAWARTRRALQRHSTSLYGAGLLSAATATTTWLLQRAGVLLDAVFPGRSAGDGAFLDGVLSRLSMLASPHWDAKVGAAMFDCGVSLVVFGAVMYLSWRFGLGVLRTKIESAGADSSRAKRAVVIALSELPEAALAQLPIAMGRSLGAFCTQGPRIAWQQNARALRHHLVRGRKLIVYVVCSRESGLQFEKFSLLLQHLARNVGAEVEVRHASGGDVDFNNYETVEKQFARTLEKLRNEDGVPFSEICIDVTSGTKVISIAAAVITMNREIEFSYVDNDGGVRLFDARLPIAGTPKE